MKETQFKQTQVEPTQAGKKILRQFVPSDQKKNWLEVVLPAVIILAIILAGGVTGYLLANREVGFLPGAKMIGGGKLGGGPKEAGRKDADSFPDKAQGKIMINDSEEITEGSHRLIRPGGESQTAYLTSSVVDLNQFIGECVEVWGETFAAQKAGWLMDIGYVIKIDDCPEGV